MNLQLPDSVSSPQDLKALELEVREYARWFAHNAIKQKVDAKQTAEAPVLSPAATTLLNDWTDKERGQDSLDKLLAEMKEFEAKAPSMNITLAAPPSNGLKKTLVAWCRENVAPNVLVTFQFNSTLLGGMVVHYGSHIFDWSFRRKILEERSQFPEVLRGV